MIQQKQSMFTFVITVVLYRQLRKHERDDGNDKDNKPHFRNENRGSKQANRQPPNNLDKG